jgi:type II secretory pathway component PulF
MSEDVSEFIFGLFWYAFLTLLPGWGFALLLHFLLSLPMRRRDRALFFLDIVETALDRGLALENAILSAAEERDRMMGMRFYLLAAHIENGSRFGEALERTPGFLHPQVNAILRAGEKMGDVKKVLPACREVLRVPPDSVRTTMHYMVTILLLFGVVACFMIWLVATFVIPRFKDLAIEAGVKMWPVSEFVLGNAFWLIGFEMAIFFALVTLAFIYLGGPGFVCFFRFRGFPVVDWITWHLPWKRKKLQRTFSAMLAVLLDGGMTEPDAVRLAGDCTANEICRKRVARIIAALQQGAKLDDAVRVFDDSGEFHWRLTNATHARGGFFNALQGWHASLEAKAFQQEETAAHATMSGVVILNGVVVALFATALFGVLIAIIDGELSV